MADIATQLDRIICGDAIDVMRTMPVSSVHCCVTSPPYWGLRDYGHDGQIGLESSVERYVERIVDVFAEVRRVLRDDGTLWLNLGDSYASSGQSGKQTGVDEYARRERGQKDNGPKQAARTYGRASTPEGLKPKDLVGVPWRVAFALQSAGWWLRQDIIWHKPNPMPESVTDRCTKAHEYVFLLTKSARYFYDAEAVKEPAVRSGGIAGGKKYRNGDWHPTKRSHSDSLAGVVLESRNRRSVWTVTPKPFKGAHFAVMPPDLVAPCVKAGCPVGGVVLDPFSGAGTTAKVARDLGRHYVGIELNPTYCEIAEKRLGVEVASA